jgi:hypothetical protein
MWLKDFPCRNFLIRELEEQIANFPVCQRRNAAADHDLDGLERAERKGVP